MWVKQKWRELGAIALVVLGIAGTLLPVIPGIALIGAGIAILGKNHRLVRRGRRWLERKGILKPEEDSSATPDSP